ncbi:DUF1800 family protein [Flammeovirga sp. SJP92]|uniref:DUF1800 domain-containing protein n=1 Tax=Flammeovirga sp. SJP92 TaxID=1775430 RepID=UPI0007887485|nr:DUF1800 domain-containing protein [Flammeovirga sp. SJP92]KXX69823.1 hypothetical protein AVL50_13110 [Flammeovirga sp. SJP92]
MNKSYKKLLHLYSRAGFGVNRKRADELLQKKDFVSPLLDFSELKPIEVDIPPMEEMPSYSDMKMMSKDERQEMRKMSVKNTQKVLLNWIDQMQKGECDLAEKMALFWHGHFACRIRNPYIAIQYTDTLRMHGLGDFKTLLLGVSQSRAMIDYLHLKQNKKKSPNEDFARELCELFTLGRDNGYTEHDVKEIARCFTGWISDKKLEFKVVAKRHDDGKKTVFGETGNFGGEEVIDMILKKKECAYFLSTKIYKYFVNPVLDEKRVQEVAHKLYTSNYDIGDTMAYIFNSSWFYQEKNIGVKIKSPIELMVTMKKQFDLAPKNKNSWMILQRNLDQVLYNPPNVAGWPGDKSWIDASRLAQRLRLPSVLLNSGEIPLAYKEDYDQDPMEDRRRMKQYRKFQCKIDWSAIEELHYTDKKCSLVELMIRGELSEEGKKYISENPLTNFKDQMIQILSLPEYQLC